MKLSKAISFFLTIVLSSTSLTQAKSRGVVRRDDEGGLRVLKSKKKMSKKMTGKKSSKGGSGDGDDDDDGGGGGPDPNAPVAIQRSHNFRNDVDLLNIYNHLENFQEHADANGGIRPIGSLGFNLTVDYIYDTLVESGYTVELQKHSVPNLHAVFGPSTMDSIPDPDGAPLKSYSQGSFVPPADPTQDFDPMTNSGSGEVVGTTEKADNLGCDASDFASFTAGSIAIIERGVCPFTTKVDNAVAAGAIGVVVYNDAARETLFGGRLDSFATVPVFAASRVVGLELPGILLRMISNTANFESVPTTNIIADTPFGNPNQTIVVGAHTDSTFSGPGLNDNGAASAMVLELALQLMEQTPTENRVRFAFWGAEEIGLVGSRHYLTTLFPTGGLSEIALYLNYDVIASPNYVRAVYPSMGGEDLQEIEDMIEATFLEYFNYTDLAVFRPLPAPLVDQLRARSDHANFQSPLVGVPSGGLITGANQEKTPELATVFGGVAGEDFDPYYHMPCDDINNVELEVLDQNTQAAAHALWTLAMVADMDMMEDQRRRRRMMTNGQQQEFVFDAPSPGSRFYAGDAL